MMKIIPNYYTPAECETLLGARVKTLRLLAGYKRSTLAKRSGVTESSLKRFETTGQVSLKNLLRLAHALGRIEEFSYLFSPPEAASIEGLKANLKVDVPKRGKI